MIRQGKARLQKHAFLSLPSIGNAKLVAPGCGRTQSMATLPALSSAVFSAIPIEFCLEPHFSTTANVLLWKELEIKHIFKQKRILVKKPYQQMQIDRTQWSVKTWLSCGWGTQRGKESAISFTCAFYTLFRGFQGTNDGFRFSQVPQPEDALYRLDEELGVICGRGFSIMWMKYSLESFLLFMMPKAQISTVAKAIKLNVSEGIA